MFNLAVVVRDWRIYRQFQQVENTSERQRYFRRWVLESTIIYGVMPLGCLALVGHLNAIIEFPTGLVPISESLNRFTTENEGFFGGMLTAISYLIVPLLLVGHTILALVRTYSEFRAGVEAQPMAETGRDIAALFPRNREERFWTAWLSVTAGVTEELCFRLMLPIMFLIVTGSAWMAILVSTLWFGLAHFYQGWVGILATTVIGALLMYVYLTTKNLWLVIIIHAIVDLNDLAIAPWFADWLRRKS